MSAKKILKSSLTSGVIFFSLLTLSAATPLNKSDKPLACSWAAETVAQALGWVESNENNCGGYYLEPPFISPQTDEHKRMVTITSNHGLVSQHGTSFLEQEVTINRFQQQITANKAFVYRDTNGKLSSVDLIGDVHLREPNTLVIAKKGRYQFASGSKSLMNIIYRTGLLAGQHTILGPRVPVDLTRKERKVTNLTAWGQAHEFAQNEPRVYELYGATYTTCPPINPAWYLQGSHIVLNKNTGKGYATHARLYIKDIPVVYIPYLNFSIDNQRKTGFLKPTIGTRNKWGPYSLFPFYLNLAPNYDMTITPGILTKRGLFITDNFRYLSPIGNGNLNFSFLPEDREFAKFKKQQVRENKNSTNAITQAELRRLLDSTDTRKAFYWRDNTQYNDHWSSTVDINYAGDDYYLNNFGNNLNEVSKNQLLQEADLYYKGEYWDFTGRLQAYQTLHPVDQPNVDNQYRRFPQFILNGDYPDQPFGFEYFLYSEASNFTFLKTPGSNLELPIGQRMHIQPGISWPVFRPNFFFTPRAQFALTQYHLRQNQATATPTVIQRALPILDLSSGISLVRDARIFNHPYQQTLEPQFYYLYVPFHKQSNIPIFDTTVNTLTYDQLFNFNRFSGLDRIGDANQLSYGVTSRFIDSYSGIEKIRLGLGEIVYFANRLVTLCNVDSPIPCNDNPNNHSNYQRLSPVSGIFNYNVNPFWGLATNAIWNPVSKQLDNSTVTLHYQKGLNKILNFSFTYARGGEDVYGGIQTVQSINNLKVTDISLVWPIYREVSAMARWSQTWNQKRLQNLLFGLQYDTCCWAVRAVGGRAFLNLDPNNNNQPTYANEFYIQFALKGLGNVGSSANNLLSNITGYNPQFGQEF